MKKDMQTWDLSFLYKSEKDPQIEKDLQLIEKSSAAFEKKYKGKDYVGSPEILAKALADYDQLTDDFKGHKPWWYFHLRGDMDAADTVAKASAAKNQQRIMLSSNKVKFFLLGIGAIPKEKHAAYLKHPSLAPYQHQLKCIFDASRYQLSDKEEQLLGLCQQTSYEMWVEGQESIKAQVTIPFKGKNIPVNSVMGAILDMPQKERYELHAAFNKTLKALADFAEKEINAVVNFKKMTDEIRGFKKPYSSTMLEYQTDEKSMEQLVALVTKRYDISHRFFRLHKKLLKQKKLTYADRGLAAGKIEKKFSYDEAVKIVGKSLGSVDPKYKDMLDRYIANRQIDAFPRKGKTAGAYCWANYDPHTVVLLNYMPNINWVQTLGHEMGHAVHSEMTRIAQPLRYREYSIATAEVASTFFEQVVGEEIEKQLSDKERVVFLHNRLQGDISTIFRQIACFSFENELHETIRKEGMLSKDKIAELMNKHMKAYIGPAMEFTKDDGYFFVQWSHIRRFFYVYTYAYGQIISRALFQKWKEDASYAAKLEEFLKAGGSKSPQDIFKSIGIDTSKPAFFEAGLKGIEADLAELEKLVAKKK